jgi:GTP pyrophosphokinase
MSYEIKEIFQEMGEKISELDQKLIAKAYEFAQKTHGEQKKENGHLCFAHVFETAKILAKMKMDPITIAAGLLHDVLDQEIKKESLEDEFGSEIAYLVNGVTKLGTLKYQGYERYIESLRKFFIAIANDMRIVIIKFASRLDNLKNLGGAPKDTQKRIAIESIDVYAPLANRLGLGEMKGQLEDAAFPYAYPKEYVQVEEIIKNKIGLYEKYLLEMQEELEKELSKNKIKVVKIDYRVKHKYSLWKKLIKNEMDLGKIYDIVALRIIVENNIEECYKVLGIIHSLWTPIPGRIKDYIAVPKINNYRSIHTTIFTGSGGIVEIQIRTKDMHTEASYGIAAHFNYKELINKKKKDIDKRNLKWIQELKNFKYTSEEDPKKNVEDVKIDFFKERIFVFTPRGDVIDLPEDSSPIDFAYTIHSDLGNHIGGVKVNKKISKIFSILKSGDIVEIIKNKNTNPSDKWLKYAKTNIAKKAIKNNLTNNSLLDKLKSFSVPKH